jgi:S-formylglutathione hydrolase
MYDYVVKELPEVLSGNFEQLNMSCASIFGHSMGGHGALTIYLKNTDKYKVLFIKTSVIWKSPSKKLFPIRKLVGVDFIYNLYSLIIIFYQISLGIINLSYMQSVSAFAPIANPINCPWGQKAFSNYLGSAKSEWEVSLLWDHLPPSPHPFSNQAC